VCSPGNSAGDSADPTASKFVTDSSAASLFASPDLEGPGRGLLCIRSGENDVPPYSGRDTTDSLFRSPWFEGDNSDDGDTNDEGDTHDEGEINDEGDTHDTEFRSESSGM